jgi:uncharacterized protein YdaU (DUF1376 family)
MEAGRMNFYPRHIGDYLKDTSHLSLLEHGVYSRLLDVYYTRESGFDEREAVRLIGARSPAERSAVVAILKEFFWMDEGDMHWSHKRCDAEIATYHDKQRKASASANARWAHTERNANASPNAMRTHTEGNAPNNQEPEPITTIAPKVHRGRGSRLPDDWEPMGEGREFALSLGIGGDAFHTEAARFCDYWRAQPGQKGVKTDWPATWRNWCRKAAENVKPTSQSFSARDSAAKAARLAEMTGGLLGAQQRPSNVIDMEEGNAPLRIA